MGLSRPEFRNGVRVNRTGRRTFTLEYKQEVVSKCRQPGASVSAIALSHGLNANVVRKWLRQSAVKPTILLPVTVTSAPLKPAAPRPQPRPASESRIEIELPGARVCLHGAVDAATLCCVLTVLGKA